MINIKINTHAYKVQMEGHANYAEEGKDIVCAAASMLLYTLAETVQRSSEILWKKPRILIEKDKPNIIQCIPKPEYKANLDTIYQTILNGFQILAEGYPDSINIEII